MTNEHTDLDADIDALDKCREHFCADGLRIKHRKRGGVMAWRYNCRRCGNPCTDTRVCPACGNIGPASPSMSEAMAINKLDLERFGRLIRRHWELVESGRFPQPEESEANDA